MDLRTADQTTQLRELVDRALSRINTSIPGVVESFDGATQTATVLPAIRMKVQVDGVTSYLDLPPIVNAPCIFPFASTAGFALTLPVRAGDPCIILFSQRAIDNWVQYGGVQNPEEGAGIRHHDLTDALVIFAAPPSTDVLGEWETDGIEIRNRSKNTRVTVKDNTVEAAAGTSLLTISDDGTATLKTDTKVTVDSPLAQLTGALEVALTTIVTGALSSITSVADPNGTMQEMRDIFNSHTHPGDSGGTTGSPNQTM